MPCTWGNGPQVLTSPGMAFQAVERSRSLPLDLPSNPGTVTKWRFRLGFPLLLVAGWIDMLHTYPTEKKKSETHLPYSWMGYMWVLWEAILEKEPLWKIGGTDQETPKTQTKSNQFVESIFLLAISKKDSQKLGSFSPQNKRSRNIPYILHLQKKSVPKKKTKKKNQKTSRNILKTPILQQKNKQIPKFPLDFLKILSAGPGAFYITVGRAISSSSDAAETLLRRRLVPSEGGKLWCFDIRGARHEMRGERKDVFRWKTKKEPRKRGRFLEVEWLILVVFCCCLVFENVELWWCGMLLFCLLGKTWGLPFNSGELSGSIIYSNFYERNPIA